MVAEANAQSAQAANQKVLDRLARVVRRADDFVLGFVKCNHLPQQQEMRQAFLARLENKRVLEIELDKPIVSLLDEITPRWDTADPPDVVCVYGLRYSIQAEGSPVLGRLNNDRELIRRAGPVPLLIWLPDYALDLVARGAPDFWAWRSGVYEFQTDKLLWEADSFAVYSSDVNTLLSLNKNEKLTMIVRLEELVRSANSLPNRDVRVEKILASQSYQLGCLYTSLGEWNKAEARLQESLQINQRAREKKASSIVLGYLGNLAHAQGELRKAQAIYEESLNISKELGEISIISNTLTNLGSIAFQLNEYPKAFELYQEALAISWKLGEMARVASILNGLGNIHSISGDDSTARVFYSDSLNIHRELNKRRGFYNNTQRSETLCNLAGIAWREGNYEAAQTQYAEALTIKQISGDKAGAIPIQINLGLLKISQGKLTEALQLFLDAWQVSFDLHLLTGLRLSQENIQSIRGKVGEEQLQTWLREKYGKKEAHRITE